MSRWFLIASCCIVLAALAYAEPTARPASARGLGGECSGSRDCQFGLLCADVDGVMDGQCTTACNSTVVCEERFGTESVCLGADLCARTCADDAHCPTGSACNSYGWCERR